MPAQPSVSSSTESYGLSVSPTRSMSAQSALHPVDDANLGPTARAQSIAEQAFTKGLERLKARTIAAPAVPAAKAGSPRGSVEISRGRRESQASDDVHSMADGLPSGHVGAGAGGIGSGETICEKDDATDGDGWVYGDNKWEGMGPKGGLGRVSSLYPGIMSVSKLTLLVHEAEKVAAQSDLHRDYRTHILPCRCPRCAH